MNFNVSRKVCTDLLNKSRDTLPYSVEKEKERDMTSLCVQFSHTIGAQISLIKAETEIQMKRKRFVAQKNPLKYFLVALFG